MYNQCQSCPHACFGSSSTICTLNSSKVDKNTIAYVTASNSTAQTNCIDSVSGRGLTVTSNAISIVDLW